MASDVVAQFFAWAPLVCLLAVALIAYFSLREQAAASPTLGKTYACASCGRRGKHEHMVPVTREGAVLWYCGRCAR